MKFGRIFNMLAEGAEQTHLIASPLTCRLSVTNVGTPSAGLAHFKLYNLAPDIRNDLFKDAFQYDIYRKIVFSAGYQSEPIVPVIYQGNIMTCMSYREGPDWVTEIDALDGGFGIENGTVDITLPQGYNSQDVFEKLVDNMPNVQQGVVGNFPATSSRGITLSGNPWDLLVRRLLPIQAQVYINKELVNMVQQREYVRSQGGIEEISQDTGLLDTPRRESAIIRCKMMFEPRIEMMQKIAVKSLVPGNNGDYKVMRIEHSGTISGAVCEQLTTMVTALGPFREMEGVGPS